MPGDRSASPEGRARSISPLTSHRESTEIKEEDMDRLNQMSQEGSESPQFSKESPRPSPRNSKESPRPSPRPRNVSGHSQGSGNLFHFNFKIILVPYFKSQKPVQKHVFNNFYIILMI